MFGLSPIEMVVIGGIAILLVHSRLPSVARALADSFAQWGHMLDDNAYKSPESEPERRSRFLAIWSNQWICLAAIGAPVLGILAIHLIRYIRSPGIRQQPMHIGVFLLIFAWFVAIMSLNKLSRRNQPR